MGLPDVTMILSDMSNMEQIRDNIAALQKEKLLTPKQNMLF